jgi:hypothetical protein
MVIAARIPVTLEMQNSRERERKEFLEVLWMRMLNSNQAAVRAQSLAKHIWRDYTIRNDPELSKLSTLRLVSGIVRWTFKAICPYLVDKPTKVRVALNNQKPWRIPNAEC